jgi:hypothetical protein
MKHLAVIGGFAVFGLLPLIVETVAPHAHLVILALAVGIPTYCLAVDRLDRTVRRRFDAAMNQRREP